MEKKLAPRIEKSQKTKNLIKFSNLTILFISAFAFNANGQIDTKIQYNIQTKTLQSAIEQISHQSKMKIELDKEINPLLSTQEIHGLFTIENVIRHLIQDKGLFISGNAQDGFLIYSQKLPDIKVIDDKEVNEKKISLQDQNARNSLSDLIRNQVLVSAPITASGSGNVWDSNGNSGFNIRGIEGNRIGLEIDGIALPEAAPKPDSTSMQAFATGREYFDLETMQEVTILNGASQLGSNHSGLGGSVQFRSKSPNDYLTKNKTNFFSYKLGSDSTNSSKLHSLTGAWGSSQIKGMLLYVKRNGKEIKTLSNISPNPDNWDSNALLTKLDWKISSLHKIELTTDLYKRDSQRFYHNRINSLYPQGIKQFALTDKKRFSVNYDYEANLSFIDVVSAKFYYLETQQKDTSFANYFLRNKNYFREIDTAFLNKSKGLSINAEKNFQHHELIYGFKIEDTTSARPWSEDRTIIDTGIHQITNKNRMAEMEGRNFSLFISDKIQIAAGENNINIKPAIRFEHRKLEPKNLQSYITGIPTAAAEIKKQTDNLITPSIRLDIRHTPYINSFVGYARNTRAVTAAEKTGTYDSFSYTSNGQGYAILGNPNLKNESSHAFEFGINSQPHEAVHFQISNFYNNFSHFIEYSLQAPDPINYPTITYGLYRPENIGKVRTWGTEISTQIALSKISSLLNGMRLDFSVGSANGTAQNTKTNARSFLPSIAPAKASFKLAYESPLRNFGIALAGNIVDKKQPPTNVISSQNESPRFLIPRHQLFDLNVFWNLNNNVHFSLNILNLNNQRYWDYANSRNLAAPKNNSDLTAINEIERQVMPGRSINLSMLLKF